MLKFCKQTLKLSGSWSSNSTPTSVCMCFAVIFHFSFIKNRILEVHLQLTFTCCSIILVKTHKNSISCSTITAHHLYDIHFLQNLFINTFAIDMNYSLLTTDHAFYRACHRAVALYYSEKNLKLQEYENATL